MLIFRTTRQFRDLLADLPKTIQRQAKKAYSTFQHNPSHPGLHFKRVHQTPPVYAVRITKDYRALGAQHDEVLVWFWIGRHAQYDSLLKRVRGA